MALVSLERLARREKILLGVGACTLLLSVGDRLVVQRVRFKFRQLSHEIESMEAQVKGNLQILARKDDIEDRYVKLSAYVPKQVSEAGKIAPAMLTEIERLATSCEVSVLGTKTQASERTDFFEEYVVSVEVEGDMENLMSFFYELRVSPQLLMVRKLELGPGTKSRTSRKGTLIITRIVPV